MESQTGEVAEKVIRRVELGQASASVDLSHCRAQTNKARLAQMAHKLALAPCAIAKKQKMPPAAMA
jgi:hypothetical protein